MNRAPNQRFRFEQYMTFLQENGFECVLSPLIATPEEDKTFYKQGNYIKKILLGLRLALRRLTDVLRANEYDVIVIAREAFITGSTFFERALSKRKGKVIFDFDDSIWLNVISNNNRLFASLKDGSKTARIIKISDKVFAGNEFLANYAKKFNNNVVIIPTTIDTDVYQPAYDRDKKKLTIGWSGSTSTIEHFQFAIPALRILKEKYKDSITIKVIGDSSFVDPSLNINGIPWRSETELDDLREIDIGIMPLPDNEWTWGKCGLKGLQYMALEIPTVMSPVGVNLDIIQQGVNGYLANSTDEWVEKISDLIEHPDLRVQMGKEGRKTVVKKYSVKCTQEIYLRHLEDVLTARSSR